MFVDIQEYPVDGWSTVSRPDILLLESNAVKELLRQAILALGQELGIAKGAEDAHYRACLALDVLRRPVVARRVAHKNAYTVARFVLGLNVGLCTHGGASRRLHRRGSMRQQEVQVALTPLKGLSYSAAEPP